MAITTTHFLRPKSKPSREREERANERTGRWRGGRQADKRRQAKPKTVK